MYSDFLYEMTVNASDCCGRSKAVRLGLSLYAHFYYKNLLSGHVSYTYKINQYLAARMVYSFIRYSDFIYEMTVHAAHYSGRSKV